MENFTDHEWDDVIFDELCSYPGRIFSVEDILENLTTSEINDEYGVTQFCKTRKYSLDEIYRIIKQSCTRLTNKYEIIRGNFHNRDHKYYPLFTMSHDQDPFTNLDTEEEKEEEKGKVKERSHHNFPNLRDHGYSLDISDVEQHIRNMVKDSMAKKSAPQIDNKINHQDYPITFATRHGKCELVAMLVGAGANINVVDSEDRSCFEIAESNNSAKILALLYERKIQLLNNVLFDEKCLRYNLENKMVTKEIEKQKKYHFTCYVRCFLITMIIATAANMYMSTQL